MPSHFLGEYIPENMDLVVDNNYTYNSATDIIDETDPEATEIWLTRTIYRIRMCFVPIIIIGTITNIMNFFVLAQKEMKFLSTSVYLLALAVADLGIMYLELFRVWFEMMDFVDPELYFSDWYCKLSNFINGIVRDFSNWLIACLTLERVIMVASPYCAKDICTVPKAKKIAIFLLFGLSIPHLHCLIFSKAQKRTWWVCWEDPNSQTASILAAIVEITVGYVVVIVVFVLNIALTVLLFKYDLPCIQTPKHKKKNKSDSRRKMQRRLTRTLIIVAIMFLVCETPRIITSFICRFMQRTPPMRIILNISFVLSGINHASNFWIYIFSSPRFRHIFIKQLNLRSYGNQHDYKVVKPKGILKKTTDRTIIKARSQIKENGVLEIHFRLKDIIFDATQKQTAKSKLNMLNLETTLKSLNSDSLVKVIPDNGKGIGRDSFTLISDSI